MERHEPVRADGSTQGTDISRVAESREGLTTSVGLVDRLLRRRFPDGHDGLSSWGKVGRLPVTATVHATATPDLRYALPLPSTDSSYVPCSAARSNTTFRSTPPSLGSAGTTARGPDRKEGPVEFLASEVDSEHADELPKSAKRETTDRGADAFESKRKGEVGVPIGSMDSVAPDISVTDESMDPSAKDVAEFKKRRAVDVAGGKRRLRRQVKTASIEDTTASAQLPPSGGSSFEHQQFWGEATAAAEFSHPAVLAKKLEQALMDPQKAQVSAPRLMNDFEVLYNTLVADPVVPAGFLTEFTELEEHARRAATRTLNKYVSITEAAASMDLECHRGQQISKDAEDRALFDQLVLQVELRPPRFRTERQKLAVDGPTGRRDAEADLRNRYLRILSDILKNTNNSMGQLLQEKHQNLELLGAGRRASTLRSRVGGVQKFLG